MIKENKEVLNELIMERYELNKKIVNLEDLMVKDNFKVLGSNMCYALSTQLHIMNSYREILDYRIYLLSKEIKNETESNSSK